MNITAIMRESDSGFDVTKPTSQSNPGGGVSTKIIYLKAALPNIQIVSDITQAGTVTLVEPLWFSDGGIDDGVANRIDRYKASKAFKILWTSDVQFARWQGYERQAIFDASDVIAGNSKYFQRMLKVYAPHTTLLTDPVDVNSIVPSQRKKKQIVGLSNTIVQKNIDTIVKVYKGIHSKHPRLTRGFIGGINVWGGMLNTNADIKLEDNLNKVCDWVRSDMTRREVMDELAKTWAYIADTRYDSFCYAMIEAMLAGCWLFCGKHLIYDERPCFRFDTVGEAVELIGNALDSDSCSQINLEGRQYVIDNYSLQVFRNQLKDIVGYGYGI